MRHHPRYVQSGQRGRQAQHDKQVGGVSGKSCVCWRWFLSRQTRGYMRHARTHLRRDAGCMMHDRYLELHGRVDVSPRSNDSHSYTCLVLLLIVMEEIYASQMCPKFSYAEGDIAIKPLGHSYTRPQLVHICSIHAQPGVTFMHVGKRTRTTTEDDHRPAVRKLWITSTICPLHLRVSPYYL